ncbi:divisome protein SepX/GlpR [Nocardia donostiensis]|uniref:Transmembrane protein n=1 Tax=Nocardia donostiensis TaxID=1538463 RepID=A0A1V2TFP6_9NOCA|nr:gephyrin-like molybdotransferase receptor GlpR [Nocardia donostiensis]ONM48326.1 hypothetical protein B0T46_13205 [Nocardia donostiensis]OQS20631.1 hypothetical protein B0T44_09775 [Nocardia donostiensis]
MPNSILWIGLVVLWVFVLFPILADRHPRIRRTTDAALATRVLHRGGSKRRTRSGHAAGRDSVRSRRLTRAHRKRHHADDVEDRMTTSADEPVTEADEETTVAADAAAGLDPDETTGSTAAAPVDDDLWDNAPEYDAADTADFVDDFDNTDPETGDSEIAGPDSTDRELCVEDRDDRDFAAPGDTVHDPTRPPPARIPPARSPAPLAAPYPEDEPDFVPSRRGRGGFDPEADAIARAARYTFRQRAVLALVLGTLLCGGLAVAVSPNFWWGCALTATVLVTYLAYLRRQVRMEEEIRRRRSARLSRERERRNPRDTEYTSRVPHRGMDRDTARALRRRSELLDFDDEDPAFEHLDPYDATAARAARHRAAGGDIRRAAGA